MITRRPMLVFEPEGIRLPSNLTSLARFRRWAMSDAFPERGRIDWMAGEVRIDLSPEDLDTHGSPKTALAADLGSLLEARDRGVVYVGRARLTDLAAGLSTEPDVTVVLFDSVEAGRVRIVRRVEIQGAADLVVECVSDSSEEKDATILPPLYHAAGVREYWLVDARPRDLRFTLFRRMARRYRAVEPDDRGFRRSEVLGVSARLVRLAPREGLVRYRLETRP